MCNIEEIRKRYENYDENNPCAEWSDIETLLNALDEAEKLKGNKKYEAIGPLLTSIGIFIAAIGLSSMYGWQWSFITYGFCIAGAGIWLLIKGEIRRW